MSLNPSRPSKRPRRHWRPVAITAAVLALAAAGLATCQLRKPEAAEYRTAPVEQGAITRSVSASGALEALVTVEVGSQISGLIQRVLVDFNDEVRKGQVLAELDPQTYESRVAQGQADIAAGQAGLRQAEAELAVARADFNRKKALVDQNIYAPATLEQSEANYRRAVAAVEAARARIAQSQASVRSQRVDLSRTVIVSPIDGVVVDRQIEPGQTVAASLQAPVLFRIAQDLSKVQVKISVDEADIGQVREGQAVRFTVDAYPDDDFRGVVTQVRKQPVTEANVVAYTVIAEAANPQGRLLPGMTANADIILEERPSVLKVPAAALRWTPGGAAPTRVGFGGPAGGARGGGSGAGMLAQQLDLDAAQRKKAEEIFAEVRQKAVAAMASGDREAARETIRRNTQDAYARLEPILNADQKAKLAALRARLAEGGRAGGDGFSRGLVHVLRDGKPVAVPVRVGATDGSSTEIRGDLRPGDEVITGGGPRAKAQARSPMGGPGSGGPPVRMRM